MPVKQTIAAWNPLRGFLARAPVIKAVIVIGIAIGVILPSIWFVTASAAAPNTVTSSIELVEPDNKPIFPSAVLTVDKDLYLLTPDSLFRAKNALPTLNQNETLILDPLPAPKNIDKVPVQEFLNFTYLPTHDAIIVLDKSGDLFEYSLRYRTWQLFRTNLPFLSGQPDPAFIDICSLGTQVAVLDPERNDIWPVPGQMRVLTGFFPAVLPWKVQPGEPNLGGSLAMAFDGITYVVKRGGIISTFGGACDRSKEVSFAYKHFPHTRPSRLATAAGTPLFLVERDNNRVLAIDKRTRRTAQFLFPQQSDLRGMLPGAQGFWIINGNQLQYRALSQPDPPGKNYTARSIDSRLDGFAIPIAGMRLPRHPGVFPGARRLYRYGIHEGLDLFYDSGAKTKVKMGTPVVAAEGGKVSRADANFKDMSAAKFAHVMYDCYRQHRTVPANEDLLRGCQVWIDHGDGLVTRYAHLSRINPQVKKNDVVNRGDLLGFVGVSGTGQDLPGKIKFPHLHFEIWLDGKYLGWGLTPAETMSVYEDIFGTNNG